MIPDIIGIGDSPHLHQWLDAVKRDRAGGLIPSWVGAIIVSVQGNGQAQLTFIKRDRWIAERLAWQVARN